MKLFNLFVESIENDCPPASKSDELNKQNKIKAKLDEEIMYMNPEHAKSILKLANEGRLCANCMAFDISEHAKECGVEVNKGYGYCKAYDFSCHSKNTCLGHGEGGPQK